MNPQVNPYDRWELRYWWDDGLRAALRRWEDDGGHIPDWWSKALTDLVQSFTTKRAA